MKYLHRMEIIEVDILDMDIGDGNIEMETCLPVFYGAVGSPLEASIAAHQHCLITFNVSCFSCSCLFLSSIKVGGLGWVGGDLRSIVHSTIF